MLLRARILLLDGVVKGLPEKPVDVKHGLGRETTLAVGASPLEGVRAIALDMQGPQLSRRGAEAAGALLASAEWPKG